MVSIVIVSHSAALAAGVRELALQMVQGQVAIATAGGIDDPAHPIGTDPIKVMAAIESVYSEDGVVVLMDLGSALLSTETAVELLSPDQQPHIYLSPAPLVEGALAAAVQASIGASASQVMQEAQDALTVKQQQLSHLDAPVTTAVSTLPDDDAQTITLVVPNKLGLHARPAARFVATANRFQANLQIRRGQQTANAKSFNQVATLGARQGDTIVVAAAGPDAAAALAAIQSLADDNFGDTGAETAPPATPVLAPVATAGEWVGIPASPGIAIGPVVQYRPRLPEVTTRKIEDAITEWARLTTAVQTARQEIQQLHKQAVVQVGAGEAAIFEAHLLFLDDPDVLDAAQTRINRQKINAEAAWQQTISETAGRYRALEDAYMQARATDVEDVGQRVLGQLMAFERPSLNFKRPSILIAADLTPSDTAMLDPKQVLGICTELGGATAHSAILARALGIPAIVGIGAQLETLSDGQTVALDGQHGRLWVEPDDKQLTELARQRFDWLTAQRQVKSSAQQRAVTKDKKYIEVAANIGGPNDAAIALEYGAEGVGLFRTEFLFMGRTEAPTEEEQFVAYTQAAAALGDKPVIIRTLDVGGDKPLPYIDQGKEENPFLGWRGIRFCLDQTAVFKPQLRAILRASYRHKIRIMFPMVGALSELQAAKALVAEVKAELKAEKAPFDKNIQVGIMIEVPSAVAIADQLAKEADFFSIGTNDLTQYVMAADRGNARVAGLAQALQPAVLRMIKLTVDAGHAANIWVGMCGELAGNAQATPLLIGLGLDELSMSAPAIPVVKAAVRRSTEFDAKRLAEKALQLESAAAVAAFLQESGD
ncbi:MAG: phosphoenolpyruvate--protein phosphotransferase [Chloroflexi bacterium]|nr:phosphoenolpyruvate--protein phosphotransferase [Chloroflexota bacterium]